MTSGRYARNVPSSSGVALTSSTGWFSVHDERGKQIGERVFGSCFRAAEFAIERTGLSWPELQKKGYRVWGGA